MIDAVVQGIEVALPQAKAFAAWHERVHLWWPPSHRLSRDPSSRMTFEPCPGGRIFERTPGGREFDWGRVERWDPPERMVHSWLPGGAVDAPSVVEVRFKPIATDRTRVEVTHTLGSLGPEVWSRARGRFAAGWGALLDAYHRHTGEPS